MEIATSSAAIEMQQEPRQSCALATIGWPNNTPHPNAEAMKVLALLDQVMEGRKVGRTGGQVGRWVGGRVFLLLWIIPPRLTTTCPVCYFLSLDHFILRFPEPFTMKFPLLLCRSVAVSSGRPERNSPLPLPPSRPALPAPINLRPTRWVHTCSRQKSPRAVLASKIRV